MYRRSASEPLMAARRDTPVVLLQGARQTGKSTLVRDLARYLTFDDMTVMAAARHDPSGFLSAIDDPIVIDEVQRVPEIFVAIKAAVDRDRRPGRFLLTGSANVLLLPKMAESLAGRMEILTLWPLSQGEIEGVAESFIDIAFAPRLQAMVFEPGQREGLLTRLVRGGYPEAISRSQAGRRRAWFANYVTTILQRDVRDLAHIEGLTTMPRLLSLLAARSGSLLNTSELSRTCGIPNSTLKRYLALLQTTFLVDLLPAWSSGQEGRLVKMPRLYVCDSGLASHLVGIDTDRLASERNLLGPLLEGFVFMELRKQCSWSDRMISLFHFRTHAGQEVDLVLEADDGRIVGVEVKASMSIGSGDLKGLRALKEVAGKRFVRGIVLYGGDQVVPFGPDLHAMPLQAVWKANPH